MKTRENLTSGDAETTEALPRARGLKRPPTKGTRYGNGAGQGDGWGGPAKGVGGGVPAMLTPGLSATKRELAAERKAVREGVVRKLEDHLYHLALNAEREETQLAAAARLHAIYEGQPVARQITADLDQLEEVRADELRERLLKRLEILASA